MNIKMRENGQKYIEMRQERVGSNKDIQENRIKNKYFGVSDKED